MASSNKIISLERGVKLLHNPVLNKGTAFNETERKYLKLQGLLPPKVMTQDLQVYRVLENLKMKPNDLEKYIFLVGLQDRNENLYYRVVIDNLKEIMPLIYTPTVGQACQSYGHLYRRSRGMYISLKYKGRIAELLENWPHSDVRIIVVTDGERILGLGDLGMDGIGIPIGKLSLYTACAGILPTQCLPIILDVGTNNKKLLNDPLYMGIPQQRLRGKAYLELVDEFIEAVNHRFPNVLVQLEDFATQNAFNLLERYRHNYTLFDDDIQGTASVAVAGIYSALKITGQHLKDQRFLFLGAGEAGIGIAQLLCAALKEEGLSKHEARSKCWLVDSKGLVCASRIKELAPHKLTFAHDLPYQKSLIEIVDGYRPTVIIGVSGQPNQFTPEVITKMSQINERPIIFALSNPTSKSECTAKDAYIWSKGKAIFASGSPFEPVEIDGQINIPGQGNNVYIFPAVGLGITYCNARTVPDEVFLLAAKILSNNVTEEELASGQVFPSFSRIRQVSLDIAEAIVRYAVDNGISNLEVSDYLREEIESSMYVPYYPTYVM